MKKELNTVDMFETFADIFKPPTEKELKELSEPEEKEICKCKLYTLEEIFYLKMNSNICPRCKIKFKL